MAKRKYTIHLKGLNKTIEMKKVSKINLSNTDKEFIYIERLPSGDWSLASTFDVDEIDSIEVIKEDI